MGSVSSSEKIQGTAGYYITPTMREKEVITPAGGGDRVRYTPYKDIERGFADVLDNVFAGVKPLDSNVSPSINNNSVDYVVSLEINTDSSSASMFTWPPTWFGVSLETEIVNTETKKKTTITAKGEGNAKYSEFIRDKGIAGKKASQDALNNLQHEILESDAFSNSKAPTSKTASAPVKVEKSVTEESPVDRLAKLKELHDSGLITSEDYEKKKSEIISTL
jgi:hypothetical protein